MKTAFALTAALALAGCATQDVQVAQAPATCKIAPVTTASATEASVKRPVSEIRQREAQMDLASSQYRMRNLDRQGLFMNNVEDAIRDCDAAIHK